MKLALVLGKQQGMQVKPRLLDTKDNLDIDCFENVPEFIDSALKRNCIYDRILLLSAKVTSKTQKDLYNYWGSTSKETQIVLLGKANKDNGKATAFLQQFKTPVVATVLVDSTTVSLIAEAVLRPTAELSRDYGIGDFLDVEVDEDGYVEPEPAPVQPQSAPQPQSQVQQMQQQVQSQPQNVQQSQPKKKGGLFSALFGGKKNKKQNNVQPQQPEMQNMQNDMVEDNFDTQQEYATPQEYYSEPVQNQGFAYNESQPQMVQPETVNNMNTNEQLYVDDDFGTQNNVDMNENSDANQQFSSPQEQEQYNSFSEPVYIEDDKSQNDFEPDTTVVDEDFSDMGYIEEETSASQPSFSTGGTVTQVDSDFSNENVADYENQYRETNEAPKVVTQTVVKEVIRNVGSDGKLTVLNGVYDGRLKKTIVVSGDRGTGVTSTALNIAQTLSKKVDVLYFDCDIYTHGLLNYIDYDSFKNYEQNHIYGVKRSRSSMAFDSCVINWTDNLYLLTSDFDCEITQDELKATADVVAERSVDFGAVVVDCPVSLLHCVDELILTGQSVTCIDGSKRGFMNMLCMFEASQLGMRYKRTFASRDTLLVTKCPKNLDLKKLISYIKAIYEPDEVNWLVNQPIPFNGKLSDKLLNAILEG